MVSLFAFVELVLLGNMGSFISKVNQWHDLILFSFYRQLESTLFNTSLGLCTAATGNLIIKFYDSFHDFNKYKILPFSWTYKKQNNYWRNLWPPCLFFSVRLCPPGARLRGPRALVSELEKNVCFYRIMVLSRSLTSHSHSHCWEHVPTPVLEAGVTLAGGWIEEYTTFR